MSSYEVVLVDMTSRELSENAWYQLGTTKGDEIYVKVDGEDVRPAESPFWKFDAPDKKKTLNRVVFTGEEGSETSICLMEQDKLSANDSLGTFRIRMENGKVEVTETSGATYKSKDKNCCHVVEFHGLPHCHYELRFCVKCFERI